MLTRAQKQERIDKLVDVLDQNAYIYLTDIAGLDAPQTHKLRKVCFENDIHIEVVKNTMLTKAIEKKGGPFLDLIDAIKGNTAIMLAEKGNLPAKIIKQIRKDDDQEKPILKAAYIDEAVYHGDQNLEQLSSLKSKQEILADVILLIKSPLQNVLSGVSGQASKLASIVQTLSEREE